MREQGLIKKIGNLFMTESEEKFWKEFENQHWNQVLYGNTPIDPDDKGVHILDKSDGSPDEHYPPKNLNLS